jgi:hypothetical protein
VQLWSEREPGGRQHVQGRLPRHHQLQGMHLQTLLSKLFSYQEQQGSLPSERNTVPNKAASNLSTHTQQGSLQTEQYTVSNKVAFLMSNIPNSFDIQLSDRPTSLKG